MSYKLFLDDLRKPPDESWVVVRSVKDFIKVIEEKGMPDVISFDHDLGTESYGVLAPTGMDAAKWLVEKELIPKKVIVHSANPTGAENIKRLLENWIKFNMSESEPNLRVEPNYDLPKDHNGIPYKTLEEAEAAGATEGYAMLSESETKDSLGKD